MKSLLLVVAISALIVNQSYKKKAAKAYFGQQQKEENSVSPDSRSYAPFNSIVVKKEHSRQVSKKRLFITTGEQVSIPQYAIMHY